MSKCNNTIEYIIEKESKNYDTIERGEVDINSEDVLDKFINSFVGKVEMYTKPDIDIEERERFRIDLKTKEYIFVFCSKYMDILGDINKIYMRTNFSIDNYKIVKGINDKGTLGIITCGDMLFACNKGLTSLDIPDNIKIIICTGNNLTELDIPVSVKFLICDKDVSGLIQYDSREDLEVIVI